MTRSIQEAISNSENLPSLPTVAVEVLRLMKSEDVQVDDLVRVVQNDPALTAKLLKTVNSAMFGLTRKVGSLKQAMVALGMRTVKVMVLSFSLADAFQSREPTDFDYGDYWHRSITTGVAARLLARIAASSLAEEAFVSGLLSDVGIVTAWRCAPDLYRPVLQEWKSGKRLLHEVEVELLGVSHAHLGAGLLQKWGLPQMVCDAVHAHHGEGIAQIAADSWQLAAVVNCASVISGLFCHEIPSSRLTAIKEQTRKQTGLDESKLDGVLHDLSAHVGEAASLLSVQVGETVDYAQLQTEAALQLAQLSIQGELDRAATVRNVQAAHDEIGRLSDERRAILEAASTDGLTKIANRAAFDQRLAEELERAKAKDKPVGLILLDVDHFKRFNDTFGHQAGDEVLRQVACCLREVIQAMGFVARYGGEEFAAILAEQTETAIYSCAEGLRKAIENRLIQYGDQQLHVTASLGAACVHPRRKESTPQQMIEEADRHLYRAKHAGRNRVEKGW